MADTLIPTAEDFLDDASARLDRLTPKLSPLVRHEDVDTVAACRELHRILAQHNAALRILAEQQAAQR